MGDPGILGLAFAASLLFAALLGVIALIDVIRRPSWQWTQSNRSRAPWVVMLVLGIVAGAFGGLLVAVVYYFFAQPALKRATPPIGAPGGYGY